MIQRYVSENPPQSGVLKRFSNLQPATVNPTTFFLVKQIYEDAIEYTGSPAGSRGLLLLVGLVGGVVCLCGSQQLVLHAFEYSPIEMLDVIVVEIFMAIIISLASIYLIIICARLELFRPLDEPIIFDRKNRKVYGIYRDASLRWRGLLRPWPCKTSTYDWDNVHAEHHAVVNVNSATVSRAHSLVFVVHQSRDDPTVIAQFVIGGIQMGEQSVPAVWEHIRRFMEENGPHIPAGEPLMQIEPRTALFQILSDMGPYGRRFPDWWRSFPITTIFALIFSPILVPGCIVLSFCAWISYKTAFPLNWPQDVLDAVGTPLSQS